MKLTELRKLIAKSEFAEEINNIEVIIKIEHLNYEVTLKGYSSIYEYFQKQWTFWQDNSQISELNTSYVFFKKAYEYVNQFSSYLNDRPNFENTLHVLNNHIKTYLQSYSTIIYPCEAPELFFLLKVNTEFGYNTFIGAFSYISRQNITLSNSNNEYFEGVLLAREYVKQGILINNSKLNPEKKSLNQLRNDFNKKLSDSENDFSNFINKTEQNYKEHIEDIEKIKENKETVFNDWFEDTKTEQWQKWYDDKIETLKRLEKTYESNLKLEKPARYWQIKSDKYYKQGNQAKEILIKVVIGASIFLGLVLVIAPDWIFKNVFKGNEVSIVRWSIVFLTLISLIVYAVRALTKYMFSSYHLARDAEERHTLTFFYLALLKDTEVNEEDRKMILQSLFSRTDTGLLKEDSSPTMPGGIFEKLK